MSASLPDDYNVLVDVDTKEEHGAASYQARELFEEAKKLGKSFIEITVAGVKRRVAVVTKEIKRAPMAVREVTPDQARDRAHARARALEAQVAVDVAARVSKIEHAAERAKAVPIVHVPVAPESDPSPASLVETKLDACWPHCNCESPTPWASRKLDGRWKMDTDEPELEQRTCRVCLASKSREIGR